MTPPEPRTVDVEPRSSADEIAGVVLAAGFTVLVVIYITAFEHYGWEATRNAVDRATSLLPYQVLFRDLPSEPQRIVREMQGGVVEAMRMRSREGRWPKVGRLADQGISPFVTDPIDRTGLRWEKQCAGLLCNYRGTPAAPDEAPSFLIVIREPDPVTGEKAPPSSVVDEEHQLLADGTLLHVTYWTRAGAPLRQGPLSDPARLGWQQVRMRTLFEEVGQQW